MIAKYRRWLLEHDTSPDQVSYDEWLAGEYVNDIATQRLHKTAATVSGDTPRDEAILKTVTDDADTDLKAALAALARSRMSRIANVVSYTDAVEQLLMERVNIGEASIDQLLATARYLRGASKDDITLLLNVVETANQQKGLDGAQFNQFNVTLTQQVQGTTLETRDGRDRTRSVLEGFIQALGKKPDDAIDVTAVPDGGPASSDKPSTPGT